MQCPTPDLDGRPCMNTSCGACLASKCGVCHHIYGAHYVTNDGNGTGCFDCLLDGCDGCEGFADEN